jgi:hypothetical protein
MQKYIGRKGVLLTLGTSQNFCLVFDMLMDSFCTSLVVDDETKDDIQIFRTMNSVYTFKKIGEINGCKYENTSLLWS